MSNIIEAKGLNKKYGNFKALDNVSFELESGRILGLIGPNGAGKTTLLKSLLGLTPFEGELNIFGLDPHKQRDELMKRVCFIADVAVLPRWIKVSQAIDFVEGVHPRFSRELCEKYLEQTKIKRNSRVKSLSKGMVVQLHLALIMAIDADLLILDEPTLGLDILFRKSFYEQLLNDYFDDNRTIIITTHQVEEIEHILSDLIFIQDGKIVLDDSMDAIADSYFEVMVEKEFEEAALAMKPLNVREVFGQKVCLFSGIAKEQLQELGKVRKPSVADLFVAKMKGEAA
ncbi:multidrug ABC transporter ATP-binding protein [Kangiella profundi]|uniref:Multidrug ABC transporter ATP-binding protein n=1 Tax=Kangiella profundi TaxID=1561924 RepID=A0A2K9AGB1_9GAMM|nr:ABC transporter ATP-binding protein [Kangiella profundi]AUD79436.1 multidrug ABC transporter ATP-binding protein [Kangiella profundi]GGE98478.1 ABC transporter ATP-binding protein [Kangiella profundi]